MTEYEYLKNDDIVCAGDEFNVIGEPIWHPVQGFIGVKVSNWPLLKFRRPKKADSEESK